MQIHHIDDNPANNDIGNLAVLCLDCHDKTQLSGGFARKLTAEQVVLYRNDWTDKVMQLRLRANPRRRLQDEGSPGLALRLATTLPDIYKEEGDVMGLITFYDSVGNVELRDRYLDDLLNEDPAEWVVAWAARLRGTVDSVPLEVYERAIEDAHDDFMVKSRLLAEGGRTVEAVRELLAGMQQSLADGNNFNVVSICCGCIGTALLRTC